MFLSLLVNQRFIEFIFAINIGASVCSSNTYLGICHKSNCQPLKSIFLIKSNSNNVKIKYYHNICLWYDGDNIDYPLFLDFEIRGPHLVWPHFTHKSMKIPSFNDSKSFLWLFNLWFLQFLVLHIRNPWLYFLKQFQKLCMVIILNKLISLINLIFLWLESKNMFLKKLFFLSNYDISLC